MIHLRSNIRIQLDFGHTSQFNLRVDSCFLGRSNDRFSDGDGDFSDSVHVGVEEISVSLVGREGVGKSLGGGLNEVFWDLRSVWTSQRSSRRGGEEAREETNGSDSSENSR